MDLNKLKSVLVEGKKHFSFITPKNGDVTLADAKSKMSVALTGVSDRCFAVKMPESHTAYLAQGFNLICDYFVIVPQGKDADVILCEMKKTLGAREQGRARKQIQCSIPLFYYIKATLKTHFNEEGKTNMHYAIITQRMGGNMASINTTHGGGYDNDECGKIDGKKVKVIVNSENIPLGKILTRTNQRSS